ncbi:MAG: ATP-grasp domain-containing protein [Eubacterium sp.]|nr:ATP-grasp domain-containing protein [Eubacterium sp.]
MNAWLIYDRDGAGRNKDYIAYHLELGAELGIDFKLIYADELRKPDGVTEDTGIIGLSCREEKPDIAIVRTIDPGLSSLLEKEGIRVYNPAALSYITNHKGRCIEHVSSNTLVPCVPTQVLSPGDQVTDLWGAPADMIVKSASGHGGTEVFRVSTREELERAVSVISTHDDAVIQPFIDGPGEDVRVYVVGENIIAAVKRRAHTGEFRANASLGGDVFRYVLKPQEEDYVRQIISSFDEIGMIGIDFMVDKDGGFIFNEIEDVVGARMLYRTYPEIDILKIYLGFLSIAEPPI